MVQSACCPVSTDTWRCHSVLESPTHPDDVRWVSKDTFEICCDEARAKEALAASWNFNTLSSLVRQVGRGTNCALEIRFYIIGDS
jgi:hypothetical protein